MNRVYPLALDAIGAALVDLTGGTMKLMLVDASYVYAATDNFLDDIAAGARISAGVTLAGTRTMVSGVLTTNTATTTMTAVAVNVDNATQLVVYVEAATDATRRLIALYSNQADSTLINVTTDNGDITVTFPSGQLLRI